MSFPATPTVGQQATVGGRQFVWQGSAWDLVATVTGHAAQHAAGGSDPITAADIGAAATSHASSHASGGVDAISIAASQIGSGTVATARLGSGTADSTTYLRGDQTWVAVTAAAAADDDQPILANQIFG
jgi:hypothetical protein